jgi:hypothetical protein
MSVGAINRLVGNVGRCGHNGTLPCYAKVALTAQFERNAGLCW